jgi:hypothetical protein
VLKAEFLRHASTKSYVAADGGSPAVTLQVFATSLCDGDVLLPLSLLQSISVVLSIWNDKYVDGVDAESAATVSNFADALLSIDDTCDDEMGLASARLVVSGEIAVSVESVRSSFTARPRATILTY